MFKRRGKPYGCINAESLPYGFDLRFTQLTMDNKYERHGAFSWCELLTTDVTEAKPFYSKLFGWRLEPAPVPEVNYTFVKCGGEQIGNIGRAACSPRFGAILGRLSHSRRCGCAAKLAEKMGAKILMGPQDIPKGGSFVC